MATPKRILVVDDDPAIHQLLSVMLASPELEVDDAFDGEEGLRRVKETPYDLVLTDVRMPGIDGLDLLRRIRQERPATRVLVMTADNTPDRVVKSLQEHAYGYIGKPFSPKALAEIVAQALTAEPADNGTDDIEVCSALPGWLSLDVVCRLEVIDRLVQFLSQMKMDVPPKEREDIAFAFREMLRNAVEHGGKLDPTKKVHVAYIRTSKAILYYIRDPGEGFQFDALPHAAVSNPDDRPAEHIVYRLEHGIRPGGFGILMARNMVDELIYSEKGNELILIKYL